MQLSYGQKKEIFDNGYVVVPGVVPQAMVEQAVKFINHSINGVEGLKGNSTNPAITDLFNKTPAKELVESVIGEGMFHSIGSAQVALRFPEYHEQAPAPHAHLDGMLAVKDGIVHNFTALIGVLLSDLPTTNAGNFTVWPGSHRSYEQYFREKGPEVLIQEEAFQTLHRSPNVPLPEPHSITGKAGDVIIAHYQLIHAAGPNTWHQIRYACFFRVEHIDRRNDWKAPLTNMWLHWPGMNQVMSN